MSDSAPVVDPQVDENSQSVENDATMNDSTPAVDPQVDETSQSVENDRNVLKFRLNKLLSGTALVAEDLRYFGLQTVIDHIQRKAIANAFSESAGHSIAVDKIDEAIQTSKNLQQIAGSIAKRKEICCRALDSVFKERNTLLNEWEEFGFAGKPAEGGDSEDILSVGLMEKVFRSKVMASKQFQSDRLLFEDQLRDQEAYMKRKQWRMEVVNGKHSGHAKAKMFATILKGGKLTAKFTEAPTALCVNFELPLGFQPSTDDTVQVELVANRAQKFSGKATGSQKGSFTLTLPQEDQRWRGLCVASYLDPELTVVMKTVPFCWNPALPNAVSSNIFPEPFYCGDNFLCDDRAPQVYNCGKLLRQIADSKGLEQLVMGNLVYLQIFSSTILMGFADCGIDVLQQGFTLKHMTYNLRGEPPLITPAGHKLTHQDLLQINDNFKEILATRVQWAPNATPEYCMQRAALFIDHIWKQEIQRKLDARERIATSIKGHCLLMNSAEKRIVNKFFKERLFFDMHRGEATSMVDLTADHFAILKQFLLSRATHLEKLYANTELRFGHELRYLKQFARPLSAWRQGGQNYAHLQSLRDSTAYPPIGCEVEVRDLYNQNLVWRGTFRGFSGNMLAVQRVSTVTTVSPNQVRIDPENKLSPSFAWPSAANAARFRAKMADFEQRVVRHRIGEALTELASLLVARDPDQANCGSTAGRHRLRWRRLDDVAASGAWGVHATLTSVHGPGRGGDLLIAAPLAARKQSGALIILSMLKRLAEDRLNLKWRVHAVLTAGHALSGGTGLLQKDAFADIIKGVRYGIVLGQKDADDTMEADELHVAAQVAVTAPAAYATEGTGAPESMVMEDENGVVDQKTENFTLPRLHFSFSAKGSDSREFYEHLSTGLKCCQLVFENAPLKLSATSAEGNPQEGKGAKFFATMPLAMELRMHNDRGDMGMEHIAPIMERFRKETRDLVGFLGNILPLIDSVDLRPAVTNTAHKRAYTMCLLQYYFRKAQMDQDELKDKMLFDVVELRHKCGEYGLSAVEDMDCTALLLTGFVHSLARRRHFRELSKLELYNSVNSWRAQPFFRSYAASNALSRGLTRSFAARFTELLETKPHLQAAWSKAKDDRAVFARMVKARASLEWGEALDSEAMPRATGDDAICKSIQLRSGRRVDVFCDHSTVKVIFDHHPDEERLKKLDALLARASAQLRQFQQLCRQQECQWEYLSPHASNTKENNAYRKKIVQLRPDHQELLVQQASWQKERDVLKGKKYKYKLDLLKIALQEVQSRASLENVKPEEGRVFLLAHTAPDIRTREANASDDLITIGFSFGGERARDTAPNYVVSVNLRKIGAGCTIQEAGVIVHWQELRYRVSGLVVIPYKSSMIALLTGTLHSRGRSVKVYYLQPKTKRWGNYGSSYSEVLCHNLSERARMRSLAIFPYPGPCVVLVTKAPKQAYRLQIINVLEVQKALKITKDNGDPFAEAGHLKRAWQADMPKHMIPISVKTYVSPTEKKIHLFVLLRHDANKTLMIRQFIIGSTSTNAPKDRMLPPNVEAKEQRHMTLLISPKLELFVVVAANEHYFFVDAKTMQSPQTGVSHYRYFHRVESCTSANNGRAMLVTGCRWAGIPAPEFATEYIETAVRQVSQQNGELAVGDKETWGEELEMTIDQVEDMVEWSKCCRNVQVKGSGQRNVLGKGAKVVYKHDVSIDPDGDDNLVVALRSKRGFKFRMWPAGSWEHAEVKAMRPSKTPAKPPKYDLILLDEDVDGNIISDRQTIIKKVKSSRVGIQVLSPNLKLARMPASPGLTKTTWKYSLRAECLTSKVVTETVFDQVKRLLTVPLALRLEKAIVWPGPKIQRTVTIEPGLYDPRRKLELRGDQEFVIPCGQKFRDVDPGCYKSSIEYILEQRKEAALSELKEEIAQNIEQRLLNLAVEADVPEGAAQGVPGTYVVKYRQTVTWLDWVSRNGFIRQLKGFVGKVRHLIRGKKYPQPLDQQVTRWMAIASEDEMTKDDLYYMLSKSFVQLTISTKFTFDLPDADKFIGTVMEIFEDIMSKEVTMEAERTVVIEHADAPNIVLDGKTDSIVLVGRKDIDLDAVIAPQMDADVAAKLKAMIDRRKLKAAHAQRERLLLDLRQRERDLAELTASLSAEDKNAEEAAFARELQRIHKNLTLPSTVVVETLANVTARVRISIGRNGHPRRQLPPLSVPTTKDAARDPNGMSFKWEGKRYICLCLSVDARAVMQKEGRFEIEYAYCCGDVETSRTRTVTVVSTPRPVIVLKGSAHVRIMQGGEYREDSATVGDAFGREYTLKMRCSRGFGTTNPTDEPHNVTYTAKRVDTAASDAEATKLVTSWREKVEVAVLKALERPFLFPAERALLRRIIDKHTRTQVQSTTLGHSQSLAGDGSKPGVAPAAKKSKKLLPAGMRPALKVKTKSDSGAVPKRPPLTSELSRALFRYRKTHHTVVAPKDTKV